MKFREDINGLRAIAVIAVVLFHFNPSWVPGGFAGVDVFFVISGFLMTGIIFKGIEQGNFSILKFYIARANRIIPALAILCLVLLVFGWFFLSPNDYEQLGKHAASSISFLSNVTYWRESGYFDAASHEKWLLHTWSLSVEWQFYIIYPIVLVSLSKFLSVINMKKLVLLGSILGFVFCAVATYKWPSASYFLLPSRAWEMMLGGVAYLYPINLSAKQKKVTEWTGIILIFSSYIFISKDTPWPGYLALIPVFGSFMVIQAQSNCFITCNKTFQKIGVWSYSIYLWHWPLVVTIYYFSFNEYYIYLGLVLSILLGYLSNKHIEKIKFNSNFKNLRDYLKCKPVYIVVFIFSLGTYILSTQGKNYIQYMFPENAVIVTALKKQIIMPKRTNGYCFYSYDIPNFKVDKLIGTNCTLGDINKKSDTLLFGDSFAGTYEPFLDIIFKKNNSSFNAVVTNWCSPSFSSRFTGDKSNISYKQCLINRKYLKDSILEVRYKNIILASSWNSVSVKGILADVEEVIFEAQKKGINIFLMPTPLAYDKNPISKFYRQVYRNEKINIKSDASDYENNNKINDTLSEVAGKYDNVFFFKRHCAFNENGLFSYKGHNVPYTLDGGHMSLLGSLSAADKFEKSSCYKLLANQL
ncbi:acyltransferase [Pseudoalteromonas sp. FUC4]|uniref:acyltransferase family protein n=1 Tax=Pseudoalteromonas sp. FUC4 TaxID=2511201 RepID=UPI0011F2129E|nr:acyltransferase family protein [Pseudoalteromonas sp. FUC4]KAA1154914.1 acyltransferase [Pseudoalteromonas sp. FUC4]